MNKPGQEDTAIEQKLDLERAHNLTIHHMTQWVQQLPRHKLIEMVVELLSVEMGTVQEYEKAREEMVLVDKDDVGHLERAEIVVGYLAFGNSVWDLLVHNLLTPGDIEDHYHDIMVDLKEQENEDATELVDVNRDYLRLTGRKHRDEQMSVISG